MKLAGRHSFLAEWYSRDCAEADLQHLTERLRVAGCGRRAGSVVRLVSAVALPADEVVFGLFDACSAREVAVACAEAGLPPVRISAAVHARPREI